MSLSSSGTHRKLSGSSSGIRRVMAKYDNFQEQLWTRSRQSVAKRHRIEQLEAREVEAAKSDEEKEHIISLFALRRRVVDFQVQELAIEISHVADVLQQLHTLVHEGENEPPPHLLFEFYNEWTDSNHELYVLRSQALEVVRESVRLRQQWQIQQAARESTPQATVAGGKPDLSLLQKLQASLGEVCLHMPSEDEPDGGPQRPSFHSILSSSSKGSQSPQEKYLNGLFEPKVTNHTFESRKVREYIKECQRVSVSEVPATTDGNVDERHLPAIHPLRYHDFLSSLSCYVVEKQRTLHSEEWWEEDVQLVLEEHIMVSVRSIARAHSQRQAEDKMLKEKCAALSAITQQQIGIKPECISQQLVPFCDAISLLKSIVFAVTPSKKLLCVRKAAKAVFEQLAQEGVDTRQVGAGILFEETHVRTLTSLTRSVHTEIFIDIWAYVIIKAEIENLMSEVAFMSQYAVHNLSTGEAGYFLTSLEVATQAILQMDTRQLLAVTDRIGHIVVCERNKYVQILSTPAVKFECVFTCERLAGYSMCVVEEWLRSPVKFVGVVLVPSDSPDAFVYVTVIKLKLAELTPAQAEFVQNVFLPKDVPGFEAQSTPLGMSTVLSHPENVKDLTLLPLDCQDFSKVDCAVHQYLSLRQLSVCSSSLTEGEEMGDNSSSRLRTPFQAAAITELEAIFRERYKIPDAMSLQEGLETTVRTVQVLCQHLDFLSIVAPTDGVFSDLLTMAVQSFKKCLLEEMLNAAEKYGQWSDDGCITPGVLQAMKDYLSGIVEKLACLGFILPYASNPCDTSKRAVEELRRAVATCQRSWHLPIHIEGTLGRKTRAEINRRLQMLAQLREKANKI